MPSFNSNEPNQELFESLRLLHERISRIEALSRHQPDTIAGLPTQWNPFSGASKDELERIAALEQIRDQHSRALTLHDALFQDIYDRLAQIQARVGIPASPPPPYAPHRPQPYAPAVYPVQPGVIPAAAPPAPAYPVQPGAIPAAGPAPWQNPENAPSAPPAQSRGYW